MMNIIWFSEIKWDYLKTRKQQILSRFPESSSILFIEPISKLLPNHFTFRAYNHLKTITIPQIRTVNGNILNFILSLSITRIIVNNLASFWFKITCHRYILTADCLITSNVFWSKLLKRIKIKKPRIPIVYDCNDNPLAFPDTPKYKKKYFLETLNIVTNIIIPHSSYIDFIPDKYRSKIIIISNGVDYELFQKQTSLPALLKDIKSPIIMYIGAISEWFDFQIVKNAAIETGYNFVLVGPVSSQVKDKLDHLKSLVNISYIPSIPHEEIPNYLLKADLCIIPFIKNKLTESVLPNKMFEYAAAGKSCVMTDFNPYLKEFSEFVSITSNSDEFINGIVNQVKEPSSPEYMRNFSRGYDWKKISNDYYEMVKKTVFLSSI